MPTRFHEVALHRTTPQFLSSVGGGEWRGDDGEGWGKGNSPPEVRAQECRCAFCLFCLVFLNTESFQITDPLINLAEVEHRPSFRFSEGATWPRVREASFTNNPAPSTSSTASCSEAPPAVYLPAGLPAWRRVKQLSWTWRMEPCTEWPVGYVERARS